MHMGLMERYDGIDIIFNNPQPLSYERFLLYFDISPGDNNDVT